MDDEVMVVRIYLREAEARRRNRGVRSRPAM